MFSSLRQSKRNIDVLSDALRQVVDAPADVPFGKMKLTPEMVEFLAEDTRIAAEEGRWFREQLRCTDITDVTNEIANIKTQFKWKFHINAEMTDEMKALITLEKEEAERRFVRAYMKNFIAMNGHS